MKVFLLMQQPFETFSSEPMTQHCFSRKEIIGTRTVLSERPHVCVLNPNHTANAERHEQTTHDRTDRYRVTAQRFSYTILFTE